MKKKILIVSSNLNIGGVQKSLISLLNSFDTENYDVDLLLLRKEGVWLEQLPQDIRLLEPLTYFNYAFLYKDNLLKRVFNLVLKENISVVLYNLWYIFIGLISNNIGRSRQKYWNKSNKYFSGIKEEYDAAIGFSGGLSGYFIVDKVKANKKIYWLHSDYRVLKRDHDIDKKYFDKIDYFVAVSEKVEDIFIGIFPEFNLKTKVMYNITSIDNLKRLASNDTYFVKEDSNSKIKLISIGRLDSNKGFDLAINVCKRLIEDGYDIRWYVLGEGPERKKLTKQIKDNKIENRFTLLGQKSNPYPYIDKADIFVHPSRFEGKSVAVDEAKILAKPILITNYPTVNDQITNNKNGIIVPISEEGLYSGLIKLINDTNLRNTLINNLKIESQGSESEINKLYELLNG